MMSKMTLSDDHEDMGDINEDAEDFEQVDDEDLPEWAKRSTFVSDPLGSFS